MAADVVELLARALALPPEARAALADSLLDNLSTEVDEDAEEAWKTEVRSRSQDLESGIVETKSWCDVRRELRNHYPG